MMYSWGQSVESGSRRHVVEYILDSDIVLYQPLVDGFGWVGHEDPTFEIRLRKHIR